MTLIPVRSVAPSEDILTLDEAKAAIPVRHSDDDDLITGYVRAAQGLFDGYGGVLGRCLVTQTWQARFDCWPSRQLRLPFPNVATAVVSYDDENDSAQTVAASDYVLREDHVGSFLWFKDSFSQPTLSDIPGAITVTLTVGYGDASAVPEPIKQAARELVRLWYWQEDEFSDDGADLPPAIMALIAPFRNVSL